jgi:hypothetical protein
MNAHLTYDNDRTGTSVGLFYNRTGEILRTGAARGFEDGVPNVFEQPHASLDLTFKQKILEKKIDLSLSFKARNLLHPTRQTVYRTPSGEEAVKSERDTSTRYSIGASMKW